MPKMEQIRDFLGQRRFAIIGISRQRGDFSRALFREFVSRGYEAVPVNPGTGQIDDRRCFARLEDIEPPIDSVLLMTAPAVTARLVRDCAAVGIKRIWMFRGGGQGAVDAEAVQFCESSGISVIAGECPLMFLPGRGLVHRLHGFVRKIAGTYPR